MRPRHRRGRDGVAWTVGRLRSAATRSAGSIDVPASLQLRGGRAVDGTAASPGRREATSVARRHRTARAAFTPSPPGASSSSRVCGLRFTPTDHATCWGDNTSGQATPPGGVFIAVTTGGSPLLRLCRGEPIEIVCWGNNALGQTAAPTTDSYAAVSAGDLFTCALTTAGTLVCWGSNGDDTAIPPDGTYRSVSTAINHSCAVAIDFTVECWGHNGFSKASPPSGRFISVEGRSRPHLWSSSVRRGRVLGRQLQRAAGRAAPLRGDRTTSRYAVARFARDGYSTTGGSGSAISRRTPSSRTGRSFSTRSSRATASAASTSGSLVGSGSLWLRVRVKNGR